jgi:YHYH protein
MLSWLIRVIMFLIGLTIISVSTVTRADDLPGQPDLTHLPLGDGRLSTGPMQGYLWRCGGPGGPAGPGGGAFRAGPWIHSDGTFDLTAKLTVDGGVTWDSQLQSSRDDSVRRIVGDGLPTHPTGVYPVSPTDVAYQYDRNPNRIGAQDVALTVPAIPSVAPTASCLLPGAIGVLLTGAVIFDAFDAQQRDAVAYEIQDACQGHPERTGQYHYHSITACIDDPGGGHSALVGYALDGFGIYGHFGESGETLYTQNLDECHGHTHLVDWDGQPVELYHYHATWEFPYTLGCFRGSPVRGQGSRSSPSTGSPGGPPSGPPGGLPGGPPPPR